MDKYKKMNNQDTICAIATASGGAIGIIRVSGKDTFINVDNIFLPLGKDKRKLSEREPYTLNFGRIIDKENNNDIIDEVLVSVFRAPHSYTGEDCVEISCHGSSYILQRIMVLLINNGCRAAGPGEYTQRAFLNGKMDLSQAEAVADLIASKSTTSHHIAMNQMRGGFSKELYALREKLLRLTSLIELELDFSDHEELEFANRKELIAVSEKIKEVISKLLNSFKIGNAIKNGIPVAIVGETNAGKSTLLNKLVGEEKAIVSDIHGTTRDIIEDTINIGDITFRFIDTAGIRDTTDKIENLGIERTMKKICQSEIILLVIDSRQAERQCAEILPKIIPLCKGRHLVIVCNKSDICPADVNITLNSDTKAVLSSINHIRISAKTGNGIENLRNLLLNLSSVNDISENDVIITNTRHYNILQSSYEDIIRVINGLKSGIPSDLVSQDLRDCIYHLGEITGGEIQTDEVLKNIFSHFCIGK